ncbi:S8 family serine peptidase [Micromonospora sp. NPDC000207]|uniref:S8 family serine peptidase n=1 Tax=Micromonospora sp. NPDC000207 TaxID=3154246 RepID=UPI0033293B9E
MSPLLNLAAAAALLLPNPLALAGETEPSLHKPVRQLQWHLSYLRALDAHRISQGQGTIVAILDTGVSPHPDLRNNLLPGKDLSGTANKDGRRDKNGHGTGMAGLVAAHGRGSNIGALGIAPKALIVPVIESRIDGQGDPDTLAQGVEYALSKMVDVISISSSGGSSPRLERAIRLALTSNVVVVAGAGNFPWNRGVEYPASEPGVVAVGGIDQDGKHADISVSGPEIDVAAPAVDIYSTSNNGDYRRGTGTSGATAIVAGAVALIRAKYPSLPAREVVHRLTATAIDKGPPGRDDQYGHGVIDLVAALTADVPPLGSAPTADPPAGDGPTVTTDVAVGDGSGARESGEDGSGVRGWVTLGVLLAAGGGWAYVARRRRSGDDPPPRISR